MKTSFKVLMENIPITRGNRASYLFQNFFFFLALGEDIGKALPGPVGPSGEIIGTFRGLTLNLLRIKTPLITMINPSLYLFTLFCRYPKTFTKRGSWTNFSG